MNDDAAAAELGEAGGGQPFKQCPYIAVRSDNVTYECTRPEGHDGNHECHQLSVPPGMFYLPVRRRR